MAARTSVRFFNTKNSYLTSESIVIDVQYADDFLVAERDWIAILPAGFLNAAHFAALKMAPARRHYNICATAAHLRKDTYSSHALPSQIHAYSSRDYYSEHILNYDQQQVVASTTNYADCGSSCCATQLAGSSCSELHKIVFKANESKLSPRNFYQLAYVRQRALACGDSSRGAPQILATSCVFYVESLRVDSGCTLPASVSLNSFMMTGNSLQRRRASVREERKRARPAYAALTVSQKGDNGATKSCTILKNLFCGVNPTQWSTRADRDYGMVIASDDDDSNEADEDDEEETIFSHCNYTVGTPIDGTTHHSDSGVEDESLDSGAKENATRKSVATGSSELETEDAVLLNRSPFIPYSDGLVEPTRQDVENGAGQEPKTSLKSSIAQFFTDLFQGGAVDSPDLHHSPGSQSMYEIGAYSTYNHNSTAAMPGISYSRGATSIMSGPGIGQTDYYQKLICQLTVSNSNMARQNELLSRRVDELDSLLKDHVQHLNSIYYTLFRNGYSALQFPDENMPASNEYNNLSEIASAMKERHAEQRHASLGDTSSATPLSTSPVDSTLSSIGAPAQAGSSASTSSSTSAVSTMVADADELKTAMLKCITRAKYDDMDEFVNWLSHDTPTSTQSYREEQNSFNSSKPPGGYAASNIKSRSLEDQLEARLRLSATRQPQLQQASRIDESTPSADPSQPNPSRLRQQTPRALSESELRYANAGGNQETTAFGREAPPTTSAPVGTNSARTAKGRSARLRAQSVNGSKIGGLLLGVSSSSSSNNHRRTRNNLAQETPRKTLAAMRSPILTLGRAPPPKIGRNLI